MKRVREDVCVRGGVKVKKVKGSDEVGAQVER